MKVPNYLTYFYREGQTPFVSICDLHISEAEPILTTMFQNDSHWKQDQKPIHQHRKDHEKYMRDRFIAKGGEPVSRHPLYMTLGDCPPSVHDLHKQYQHKIILPLSIFKPGTVSFTYPDSLFKVPLDELDRIYLDRDPQPEVYTLDEMEDVIERYKIFEINNHYIEAQVWDTAPITVYIKNK